MRAAGMAALGLLIGFLVGVVVSDLLVVQFDNVAAAKGLPLYVATAFAVALPLIDRRRRG